MNECLSEIGLVSSRDPGRSWTDA